MTRRSSHKNKKRKRIASATVVGGDDDDAGKNQPLSSPHQPSPEQDVPGADALATKTNDKAPLGVSVKSASMSAAIAECGDGGDSSENIITTADGIDDDVGHCADVATTSEERRASEKEEGGDEKSNRRKKKKVRRLELTEVESFNAKLARRGVLYIARIPPAMGPARVKSLLSDFGEVTRIYLAPEDESVRKRRRRAGGHGAKRYVEGWAEFADRRVARRVGDGINNTPITNNKRSRHYGDLWSVKYLRKFTWDHLTEKVAYERRVREQRLAVEMVRARRENAEYAALVEEGKTMDKIEERRRKKAERKKGSGANGGIDDGRRRKRSFRQTLPVEERKRSSSKAVLGSLV